MKENIFAYEYVSNCIYLINGGVTFGYIVMSLFQL